MRVMLSPAEALELDVRGRTDAGVLVPLYLDGGELHCVFTKRREDLRRHPGEISFPGGRSDEGTRTCAARRCARPMKRSACRSTPSR